MYKDTETNCWSNGQAIYRATRTLLGSRREEQHERAIDRSDPSQDVNSHCSPSSGRGVQKSDVPFLHRIINRNVMMTTERRKRSITTSFVFLTPDMMHLEGEGVGRALLSFSLVVSSICDAMPKEAQLHLLVSQFDSGCASSPSTSSFPSTAPNPNLINFSRRRAKNLR